MYGSLADIEDSCADIQGSFADIQSSVVDIQGSFADIQGSFVGITGLLCEEMKSFFSFLEYESNIQSVTHHFLVCERLYITPPHPPLALIPPLGSLQLYTFTSRFNRREFARESLLHGRRKCTAVNFVFGA